MLYTYIWYPPKKKPTFCHFLTVFTVFCNLFGTLNFEANFEGGPYIYIYILKNPTLLCTHAFLSVGLSGSRP